MPTPNRDPEHLARLQDYYAENRRIPTQQRIADLIGFSKAAARKLLDRLEIEGFIERTPDGDGWIPSKRFFERAMANDAVRAGAPDMIQGDAGEPFLVDQYLVRDPSRTVMIPIKGDSMIDAGIHDGDVAVIERGRPASKGDFVIAIVDNEFTLKELDIKRGQFILKPHNPAYPVIRPKGKLEIFGVLVGLARRYSH
ncbi:MAG: LexA family transcriptional regulator [Proteobacteria bacterium]|nr:LexA family transcriptional regulator [Pseudomonadota bacterium]